MNLFKIAEGAEPFAHLIIEALRGQQLPLGTSVGIGVQPDMDAPERVQILLPGQQPDRTWAFEGIRWLVPSLKDAGTLMHYAEAVGLGVDASILRWTCDTPIETDPPEGKRTGVYSPSGYRVPRRSAETVGIGDADLLAVQPSSLHDALHLLHRGVPLVVDSASSLAEYVIDGVTGIVCPTHLIEDAATFLLQRPDWLRQLTVAQPGIHHARRELFAQTLRRHICGRALRVVFAHGRKIDKSPHASQPINARGIRYQAFVDFGAQVETVLDLDRLKAWRADFIFLGGRVPPKRVAKIAAETSSPIVLAFNDAVLEMPERLEWFREVAQHAALIFCGEPPELLPDVKAEVVQLHQAPLNLLGPRRGTVRPPAQVDEPFPLDSELDVVFLANHWYPRRLELVRAIAGEIPIRLFGMNNPHIPGASHTTRVRGREYARVMRSAYAVLSSSICNDRNITSCRLFEACSVGAYVVAEAFPGCRDIYPDDCVSWFDTPEEAIELFKEARQRPRAKHIIAKRWAAMELSWRRYSAHDRMRTMLDHIRRRLL